MSTHHIGLTTSVMEAYHYCEGSGSSPEWSIWDRAHWNMLNSNPNRSLREGLPEKTVMLLIFNVWRLH